MIRALWLAAVLAGAAPDAGVQPQRQPWPSSLDTAAQRIRKELKPDEVELVRRTPRDDLIKFHRGWGSQIRTTFGLWQGNNLCGPMHADECSMLIIERVWELLQRDGG